MDLDLDLALASLLFSVVSIFLVLPLGWGWGVMARKLRIYAERKRWSRRSVIYAEYESPDNLRPGEVAYLYDKSFGRADLLATLFDLELQNRVKLSPISGKSDSVDFSIQVIGDPMDKNLLEFEQEVLVTIKSYGNLATWRQLNADTAIWDSSIERYLQAGLRQKGYIANEDSKLGAFFKYSFIGMIIAGLTIILPIWLGHPPSTLSAAEDTYASLRRDMAVFQVGVLWLLGSAGYGLAAYYGFSAYYRGLDIDKGTKRLRKIWPHLAGFREYLRVVEQDRIKFENKTLRAGARQHALPYATALNLTTRWQDRFPQTRDTRHQGNNKLP